MSALGGPLSGEGTTGARGAITYGLPCSRGYALDSEWRFAYVTTCAAPRMNKGRLIGKGRNADVFEWGSTEVLKLFHLNVPAERIYREAETAKAIRHHAPITPAVSEVIQHDGRTGIVFERLGGPTMEHALCTRPWRMNRFMQELAELHVRLHCRASFPLPTMREKLEGKIERRAELTPDRRRELLGTLRELEDEEVICHGDLHMGNVLITRRGPMAIDWSYAKRGNRAADIAITCFMLLRPIRSTLLCRHIAQPVKERMARLYFERAAALQPGLASAFEHWYEVVAAAPEPGLIDSRRWPIRPGRPLGVESPTLDFSAGREFY